MRVKLFEAETGKLLKTFETNESHTSGGPEGMQMTTCCGSEARSATFSPDGTLIVSGHEDGTIKLWDVKGGKLLRVLKGSSSDIRSVVFSPDGKFVVSGNNDEDGRIELWSVRTGKLARRFGEDSDYVRSLAFSPDSRTVVSGGENQNLLLWDVQTGRLLWHVLPVEEVHKPTAEEVAEQRRKESFAAEEERRAEREVATLAPKVFITFDHYGEPTDPMKTRRAETDRPDKSLSRQTRTEATGIWLRLHNDSPLLISLSTESVYLPGGEGCGYRTESSFYGGLCEGAEIGIRFGVLNRSGNPVPYGFDFVRQRT